MLLRTPWVRKPPLGVGINPAASLARGLRRYWVFNENGGVPFEMITRARGASVTAVEWTAGETGPALSPTSGSSDFDTGYADLNFPAGAIAFKFFCPNIDPLDGASLYICGQRNGLQIFHIIRYLNGNVYAGWYWDGAEARIIVADAAILINMSWATFVLTWGPFGTILYRNGVVVGSDSTVPTVGPISDNFHWLGSPNDGPGAVPGSKTEWGGIWDRALSSQEAMKLTLMPYGW